MTILQHANSSLDVVREGQVPLFDDSGAIYMQIEDQATAIGLPTEAPVPSARTVQREQDAAYYHEQFRLSGNPKLTPEQQKVNASGYQLALDMFAARSIRSGRRK